jgi:hypothetical protein
MPQRIGLNLLNPQMNNLQTIRINNIINNQMNQNTQFRGFSGGRFNSMIGNIVNSKPGCGACGK